MFKLALSAGHGKYTAGKRCLKSIDPKETREWTLNDRIADKIETMLKDYEGYELLRVNDTTGEVDTSLSKRTTAANKFGADFYLSIHHNAGIKGGSGGGIVAYVYKKASAESQDWQKKLYDSLIQYTGLKGNRSKSLGKANFHEVRVPKAPAVLLELGFMDSKVDTPIILTEEYADKCAKACVEVIVTKAGLKKKEIKETVSTDKEPVSITVKENKILEWQEAAIKDGYKFPKYGADGKWGSQCIAVATNAICKKQLVGYKNKNLTKIIQKAIGLTGKNVDGLFGNNTRKKVIEYQKQNGLKADGIVGYNTWRKILGV